MRYALKLPRLGLAHRTMLLLVAAVSGSLLVLAVGFALQRRADYTEFADARARGIAAQVHSTRLVLLSVPRDYRSRVSEGLRASGTVNLLPAGSVEAPALQPRDTRTDTSTGPGMLGAPPADSSDISEAIARYTLPPTDVRFTDRPGPRYWVKQDIDGDPWWIVVLAGTPPPPQGLPWLYVAAVLLGLLAVAALYAATITRPLRTLAQATRRIGDAWPEPLALNGPAELRDLAHSFNQMLVRLRQIENERLVLLGGLPHDLRSPLTRLRLRLATLTDLDEHPAIADDIASIDRIVRQFSEYLRGVHPDEPRMPLQELLESAVESRSSLKRDVRIDSSLPVSIATPQFAVRRLVDNLIDNALQHGCEPVLVRARRCEAGVELAVLDQGAGIPPEAADAALEPFTKLDPSRAKGGCGLGLAIVRQLARQLGGEVGFERGPQGFGVVVTLGVECTPSLR